MRINFYEARLSEDDRIILVKDKAVNYKAEKLNAPDKIAKMMRELLHMGKMAEEYCYMIALSSACRILGIFFISKGTVNATLITPRELYIRALLAGAVQVILCYNHPLGNVMPSDEDIEVTNRVKKAGDVNEGMNNILFGNEEYMGIQKEIDGLTEQLENLGLTTEQHLAVDRLISSYTASGACYGRLAYRKGFQDCISLLQEMCLIGAAYR